MENNLINEIDNQTVITPNIYYQLINIYGRNLTNRYLDKKVLNLLDTTKDFYENQLEIFKKYGYYLATLKKNPYQEELEKRVFVNLSKEEKLKDKIITQKEEIYYGFHLLKRPYIHILKDENNNITLDLYKIINSIKTKEMAEYFLRSFTNFYQICYRTSNFDNELKKVLKKYQENYLQGHIPTVNEFNLNSTESSDEVLSSEYLKDQIDMYIDYSIARYQFESRNSGLIKKYINNHHLNENEEDFFQDGMLGIIRAVDTFDIRKGYRFSGYALISINNYILRSKFLNQSTVHTPVNLYAKLKTIQAQQQIEYLQTGKRVSLNEMMDRLNISDNDQKNLLFIYQSLAVASLNKIIFENDKLDADTQLEDIVADSRVEFEKEVLNNQTFEELLKIMDEKLEEREKDILLKRSGYQMERIMTFEEIGRQYGCTKENIRLIQNKALKKLKQSPKVKALNPYQ